MFLEISFNINFKRFNFKRLCIFFKPFMDFRLGPKGTFCGMCHYAGAVVACSTDKSIKILENK